MVIFQCVVLGIEVGIFLALCVACHETLRLNTETRQLLEEHDAQKRADQLELQQFIVAWLRQLHAGMN